MDNVIPAEAGNAYLYDKVGNRTSMMVTDSGGTRTHVYTYDNMMSLRAKRGNLQITEVNYPSGFDYLATDTTFNEACPERSERDAAGNRTSVIKPALREGEWGSGTCTYTTNALNQYTAAGTTSYQYDDSGNLVHDENYAYGYDPENRLVLVRKSGPCGTLDYETVTKYVYDGAHCIAEYNAYNQLKRKYIYGPGVDQPICMIDTMTSPAVTSYYHFDGLGSVVALTDDEGDTVQVYEYDVYGRPGATDASHPNRIMFTGREYDKETGLYYYRARYYNPQIGRFLQTDPIGYGSGMNMYSYCGNNSTNGADPTGLYGIFLDQDDPRVRKDANGRKLLTFAWVNDDKTVDILGGFKGIDDWASWAKENPSYAGHELRAKEERVGWALSGESDDVFPYVEAAIFLTTNLIPGFDLADIIHKIEDKGWWGVTIIPEKTDGPMLNGGKIEWNFDRVARATRTAFRETGGRPRILRGSSTK
jgi:RHS repeat-associated protein